MGGRLIRRTWWPPREFRTEGHNAYYRQIIYMRKKVWAAYDTMGRVEVHDSQRLETIPSGEWSRPKWAGDDGSRLRVSAPADGVEHAAGEDETDSDQVDTETET